MYSFFFLCTSGPGFAFRYGPARMFAFCFVFSAFFPSRCGGGVQIIERNRDLRAGNWELGPVAVGHSSAALPITFQVV